MVVAALAVLVVAAAAYRDLRQARSDLVAARQTLQKAIDNPEVLRTAPGRAQVRAEVDAGLAAAASARRRVHASVTLRVAVVVPGLRTQRSGLLTLTDDAVAAATVGRDLLAQVDAVAGRTRLQDGLVPIDGARELQGDAAVAGQQISGLVRSSGGLWGPVGDARRKFDEVARSAGTRLTEGSDALTAALGFMGAGGDRRYLIAVENNAEMRDQGAVLQFVVARFTGRRLVFERNGSVGDLPLSQPAPTPIPAGTDTVFGPIKPTQLWQSVNGTADFAWSGRAAADMYGQATAQSVDGVIAVDVPALGALLRVVGPVQVPGLAQPVTAQNVGPLFLHDQYVGLPARTDPTGRRERLGEVTRAVIDRLTHGAYDALSLGQELGEAAKGGHLRLWSRDGNEEGVFERTGLGGGPGSLGADHTFHLAVENRGATKLDYYVKPSVRQDVELSPRGTAVVRTTVALDNQAPVGAPPSYQLGPDGVTQTKPGDYLAWLLLWGPAGAVQRGGIAESGLTLSQHVVPVDAGHKVELTFETAIPNAVRDGRLELRLVPQPRLQPMDLQVQLRAPGWHVGGTTTWRGPWDRVVGLSWRVTR